MTGQVAPGPVAPLGSRLIPLLTSALLISLTATTVLGSHGGPRVARVLGFDAREKKIYYEIEHRDEGGLLGGVWYFDLKAKDPTRAVRARSMEQGFEVLATGVRKYQTRVAALLKRLQPLPIAQVRGLFLTTATLSYVEPKPEACGRFEVRVTLADTSGGGWGSPTLYKSWSTVCTTYVEPRVSIAAAFEVPDEHTMIVLAFRGVPYESCYERQVPVLVPRNIPDWAR